MPKSIRLNTTHHYIVKNFVKKLQHIASNHLSDIGFKDFMKLYKEYTIELYSLFVNDTTLSSDNSFRFRKNLL